MNSLSDKIDNELYNPQDAKRAEILLEFTFWLDDYIREQEERGRRFLEEDVNIGNLDIFEGKLETLHEVRDKLNQIKERIF